MAPAAPDPLAVLQRLITHGDRLHATLLELDGVGGLGAIRPHLKPATFAARVARLLAIAAMIREEVEDLEPYREPRRPRGV